MAQLLRVHGRRVRARLAGSSSPVLLETESGLLVAKLRGAGQGVAALVAEVLVSELAELLGLPVPERLLVELPEDVPSLDKNDELAQLLRASAGLNLGFRWLEGATPLQPRDLTGVDPEFAARVLWLDGWVMNPDRTERNPNILFWKRRPWLIDHGAALPVHHRWQDVTEATPRESTPPTGHLFADFRVLLDERDRSLASLVTRDALGAALDKVPSEFLADMYPEPPTQQRRWYQTFLWKRLKSPRPFL